MEKYGAIKTVYLGESDIASLTIRYPMKADVLNLGGDGAYNAYLRVDSEEPMPEHYTKVSEGSHWIKIFDDNEMTFDTWKFDGNPDFEKISIYTCGDYGIIIDLITKK